MTKEELRKEIARYEKRLAYLKSIANQCDVVYDGDIAYDITECEETLQCLREKETFSS